MKKIILFLISIIGFILLSGIVSQPGPIFGIYEVCSNIEECNPEKGIEKIKAVGAKTIIVTVVDEEADLKSAVYYPSKYLPMAENVPNDYLKRIIRLSHENQIKVYALINLPHNYWLEKHPDWIAVWSNGEIADTYEDDYFHRIVPPSRIISEEECLVLLKNIINELTGYGVDGVDINDNFQFSDQYLEETNTILFSSFDDFTIKKFEKDTGLIVLGDSVKEKADYLMKNPDWFSWRAEQVLQLIKFLKQLVPGLLLRPHLLTHANPYQYYGLDYQKIAKEVDVLYLMITPDEEKEKYFEVIKGGQDSQAKEVVVSTYLFEEEDWSVIERNKDKILERISWIREAGPDEIYVYDFRMIEQGNFWLFLKDIIVDKLWITF